MNSRTRFVLRNAVLATALGIGALSPMYALAQSSKSDVNLETAVTTNAAVLGSTANQTQEIAAGSPR